jgi:hypothetical protein
MPARDQESEVALGLRAANPLVVTEEKELRYRRRCPHGNARDNTDHGCKANPINLSSNRAADADSTVANAAAAAPASAWQGAIQMPTAHHRR